MHRLTASAAIALLLGLSLSAQAERLVLASASYGKNIVAICDLEGKVLWSHKTAGGQRGHAGSLCLLYTSDAADE